MAHHPQLYQTILDHPHDDAPRLIYADWLEEHGDSVRADFIRLQCRLATMDEWEDDYVPLREQIATIKQTYGKAWLAEFPGLKDRYPRFVRGFVGDVSASHRWWLRQGKGISRRTPIEELWLESSVNELEEILAAPWTARLSALHLKFQVEPVKREHVELLARTAFRTLRLLDLSSNRLTPLLIEPLAKTHHWPELRELDLGRNSFLRGGLGSLVREQLPWQLQHLSVRDCQLERMDIDALLGSSLFESLHTLDLSCNRINHVGQRPEWEPTSFGQLRGLNVESSLAMGLAAGLAKCPATSVLRSLSVAKTHINARDFKTFVEADPVQSLQELRMEKNYAGDGGMGFLAHSPVLPNLNVLDLSENDLTALGIARLMLWPGLAHVRELRLGFNAMGDDGLKAIAQGPPLPNLHVLYLKKVNATDVGAQALAAAQNMPQLTTLVLGNNPIGDAGVKALIESRAFRQLRRVTVETFRLHPTVRKALSERFVEGLASR